MILLSIALQRRFMNCFFDKHFLPVLSSNTSTILLKQSKCFCFLFCREKYRKTWGGGGETAQELRIHTLLVEDKICSSVHVWHVTIDHFSISPSPRNLSSSGFCGNCTQVNMSPPPPPPHTWKGV